MARRPPAAAAAVGSPDAATVQTWTEVCTQWLQAETAGVPPSLDHITALQSVLTAMQLALVQAKGKAAVRVRDDILGTGVLIVIQALARAHATHTVSEGKSKSSTDAEAVAAEPTPKCGLPQSLLQLQLVAATVLANLATDRRPPVTSQLLTEGAADAALAWLQAPAAQTPLPLAVQAAWVVGNLSNDVVRARDALLLAGTAKALLALVHRMDEEAQAPTGAVRVATAEEMHTVVWAASNLARGSPPPRTEDRGVLLRLFHIALQSLSGDSVSSTLATGSSSFSASSRTHSALLHGGVSDALWGFSFLAKHPSVLSEMATRDDWADWTTGMLHAAETAAAAKTESAPSSSGNVAADISAVLTPALKCIAALIASEDSVIGLSLLAAGLPSTLDRVLTSARRAAEQGSGGDPWNKDQTWDMAWLCSNLAADVPIWQEIVQHVGCMREMTAFACRTLRTGDKRASAELLWLLVNAIESRIEHSAVQSLLEMMCRALTALPRPWPPPALTPDLLDRVREAAETWMKELRAKAAVDDGAEAALWTRTLENVAQAAGQLAGSAESEADDGKEGEDGNEADES